MPVSIDWYDADHTAVIIRIQDPWTLPDLSDSIQTSRALMASVDYTVDAIWDATETSGAPSNIFSHFMLPNEDTEIPPNQGAVVVVVATPFLKSFVAMAKRLLPRITQNMHIVTDLEAANAKLVSLRETR